MLRMNAKPTLLVDEIEVCTYFSLREIYLGIVARANSAKYLTERGSA